MKKRMKKIDVLASVLLIGVISATVLGQVGPPVPVVVNCVGGTWPTINGPMVVPNWTCEEGESCVKVTLKNEDDEIIGYATGCATAS